MNASIRPNFLTTDHHSLPRIVLYGAIGGGICLAAGIFTFLLVAYAFGLQKFADLLESQALLAGASLLLVYGLIGILAGILLYWTRLLNSRIDSIEALIQNHFDTFISRLIDQYASGAAGIDVKTLQQLLETDQAGLLALLPRTGHRFSPTGILHAWVMNKTITLFRLGLAEEFIGWLSGQGKQLATLSDLESFGRQKLVKNVVGRLEAQISGLRKQILTVVLALIFLPLITNLGLKLYVRQFPGPTALISHYADQYQRDRRQAAYRDDLQGLQLVPDCRPYRHQSGARRRGERVKPHVDIYLLGQTHFEKIVLTSAITRVLCEKGLARYMPLDQLMEFPVENELGLEIRTAHIDYYSTLRHYAHVIGYSDLDDIRNLVTGVVHADGAILSVSANMGIGDRLARMVKLALQCGIDHLVVFIDRSIFDPGDRHLNDIVVGVKALLQENGYPDPTPIISGSSLQALKGETGALAAGSVLELIDAIDKHIPDPIKKIDQPFMMPVEDAVLEKGLGLIVFGKIRTGRIRLGDTVEIIGLGPKRRVSVNGVQMFGTRLGASQAEMRVGIVFNGLTVNDVTRGQVLVQPDTMRAARQFEALVYMLAEEMGGRQVSLATGYRPQFYFWTTSVTGSVVPPSGVRQLKPGKTYTLGIKLVKPMAMRRATRFVIREGRRSVAAGVVIDIVD